MLTHTYRTETAAHDARRELINQGAQDVSLVAFDPSRNVYVFDTGYFGAIATKRTAVCWVPGNRADRARFAALSPEAQEAVRAEVDRLYDGSRTLAACWKLALA